MAMMKSSNTEWLGDIPAEWDVAQIGNYYELRNEKVSDYDFEPLSVTMNGIVPQLATAAKSDDHSNRKLVKKGDFVINSRSDRRGSCGISPLDGSVSLINTVMEPRGEMNPQYYNCLFHTEQFADEFYKWGHGIVNDLWTTRWQEMKKILIVAPSPDEQQAIADYLDETCSQIDEIIAEAKASIDEYKELRQSVIFEAVTKGLDKNVEMKDSGIEWIGETPDSWNIRMLNQYVSQVKCKNSDLSETNLLSLSYGKIKRKDINSNGGLLPESFDNYNIVDENDIVLRLTDLQNDHKSLRVGLVTERGIITSAYVTVRPKKINAAYLAFLLHAFDYKKGFYGMGSGIRQGLTFDGIKSLKIVVPSNSEQDDIVNHIMKMTEKCDSLIAEKESLINDLEAYKKSLIYEVVTGKRRVV